MFPNFDLNAYITKHIYDSHEWHIPFLGPIPLGNPLTLHTLMVLVGTTIMLMLFLVLYRKEERVPTGITNCLEMFVVYIRDEIAIANMGEKDGLLFTPMLCTFFFFILILNLLGLIPLFATATSNVNVTGPLAFLIFTLMVIGTLIRGGLKGMWHALIPSSLPKIMVPYFLIVEPCIVLIRGVVLSIRLFANMMAGHMVISSFLGLFILFGWVAFPAIIMAVFIYALELFVAFLQAYIFVLLSAIFIGQMYHPEH